MNSKVEPAKLEDLLALFEDAVQPEDVLYAKISSQVSSSITKERLRLKMSQKEFANHIHCQQSQVSLWESGKYNFSLRKLSEISATLDMDLNISLAPRKVQRKEPFSTDTMMYSEWVCGSITQKETLPQTSWLSPRKSNCSYGFHTFKPAINSSKLPHKEIMSC